MKCTVKCTVKYIVKNGRVGAMLHYSKIYICGIKFIWQPWIRVPHFSYESRHEPEEYMLERSGGVVDKRREEFVSSVSALL